MSYIFLNDDDLDGLYICREYRDWLEKWLTKINENIEKESYLHRNVYREFYVKSYWEKTVWTGSRLKKIF